MNALEHYWIWLTLCKIFVYTMKLFLFDTCQKRNSRIFMLISRLPGRIYPYSVGFRGGYRPYELDLVVCLIFAQGSAHNRWWRQICEMLMKFVRCWWNLWDVDELFTTLIATWAGDKYEYQGQVSNKQNVFCLHPVHFLGWTYWYLQPPVWPYMSRTFFEVRVTCCTWPSLDPERGTDTDPL